jgi:pimeloyl-ACP methyl ester carboxylesterase
MTFSAATNAWLASGRHVTVGEQRLFVVERGEGPVLVLVHGFPTSSYDYRALMQRLSGRYRCIAFDFPGYGLSSKPEAYSYSLFAQADAMQGLLAALGVQRATLVCHDMGTSVLCELLARKLEGRLGFELERAVITNGSMLQWRATITPFQKLLASNETLLQGMELCERMPELYAAGLRSIMKRPEAMTEEDALVIRELLEHEHGQSRLPALAGYMRERYVHKERWISALERSEHLLELVWAADDPIANLEMGRELHAMLPAAPYTELDGVGHFLIFEDPDRVAAAIAR